jgi:hypothetical protein
MNEERYDPSNTGDPRSFGEGAPSSNPASLTQFQANVPVQQNNGAGQYDPGYLSGNVTQALTAGAGEESVMGSTSEFMSARNSDAQQATKITPSEANNPPYNRDLKTATAEVIKKDPEGLPPSLTQQNPGPISTPPTTPTVGQTKPLQHAANSSIKIPGMNFMSGPKGPGFDNGSMTG